MKTTSTTPNVATPCPFSRHDLGRWRERLLAIRREAVGDLASLAVEVASELEPSQMTDTKDAAQIVDLGLLSSHNAEVIVEQIDRAIRKIDHAQPCPFGICESTGVPIETERLQLMPWTPFCVEAATAMEGKTRFDEW